MNIKAAVLQLEIHSKGGRKYRLEAQHIYIVFIFSQSGLFTFMFIHFDVSLLAKGKTSISVQNIYNGIVYNLAWEKSID